MPGRACAASPGLSRDPRLLACFKTPAAIRCFPHLIPSAERRGGLFPSSFEGSPLLFTVPKVSGTVTRSFRRPNDEGNRSPYHLALRMTRGSVPPIIAGPFPANLAVKMIWGTVPLVLRRQNDEGKRSPDHWVVSPAPCATAAARGWRGLFRGGRGSPGGV